MTRNRSRIGANRRYKQGYYLLQNPDKYLGNPREIVYRSSWEHAFCKFCDLNDNVRKWSSEGLEIPYQITNDIGQTETHRYYPDFYLEMIKNGDLEKYDRLIVEIKPKSDTEYPLVPKKQTLKMLENHEYSLRMYKKNLHKWSYAKEWCEKRNMKFIIITEIDLKKKGLIP